MRSPGYDTVDAMYVDYLGSGDSSGSNVFCSYNAVRPVLNVNLSSSYVLDAGTVTSDGNITEGTKITKSSNEYRKPITSDDITTWDCVYFGNYKQKIVFEKKPIEWRVLSVNGNDALVVAEKALDCMPYNTEMKSCTWETCTFRDWINGLDNYENDENAFINLAFANEDKSAIISTNVVNNNPSYSTSGGNVTHDKIYLLSLEEVSNTLYGFDEIINNNSATRIAKGTDYAKLNGAYVRNSDDADENCLWWLRSPGKSTYYAAYVGSVGWGDDIGDSVNNDDIAVRPAMHVNLSSPYVKPAGTVSAKSGINTLDIEVQKKIDDVTSLISSIGTVTKDSNEKIKAARTAYDNLTEDEKALVTNYATLTTAETKYAEIVKEESGNSSYGNTDGNNKGGSGSVSASDNNNGDSGSGSTSGNNNGNNTGSETSATTAKQDSDTTPVEQIVKVPSKAKITFAKNSKKKSIVVKWKKLSNTKGYELQYAINKKFTKSKKTKTITSASNVSFTVKKLKKGKTYYVRVRAYNKGTDSKMIFGKWCAVKKIKVRK